MPKKVVIGKKNKFFIIYDGGTTTTQQRFISRDGETTSTISLSGEGEQSGYKLVKFGRLNALGLNETDEELLEVHNKTV